MFHAPKRMAAIGSHTQERLLTYPPPDLPKMHVWTDAERARSLEETLRDGPPRPVWVFGYGSLIWDPCFTSDASVPVRLPGYARRPCLWSIHSRGTPELPGLAFGLDAAAGQACDGVAYRLIEDRLAVDLPALWEREMYSGMYRPTWCAVEIDGASAIILTFVADRAHPQYAGELPADEMARIIAGADGVFGCCADYFRDTLASLDKHGMKDAGLEDLMRRIDTL